MTLRSDPRKSPTGVSRFRENLPALSLWACLLSSMQAMCLHAQDQEFNLPVYRLTIDPGHLKALYGSPRSAVRYPARMLWAGQSYECEVRFRGATVRTLPKKSWKVWFEDRSNPFASKELNLNAEYRDISLMRNTLAMKLYQFLGHAAPNARHVNLIVNDQYMGVFVHLEEPNRDFLRRYGHEGGDLYKSEDHGGSTAPLLDYDSYRSTWNKKVGDDSDYSDVQRLLNQLFYLSHEDFEEQAPLLLDVEDVLRFFAVAYSISSFDSLTKNTLLFFDPKENRHRIFPWDQDSSFGNHWTGQYRPYYETIFQSRFLSNHLLFRRLMEHEQWRESFWRQVSVVIDYGFDALEAQIDLTYELIRSDVYRDPAKVGTNAEFDMEVRRVKDFLAARKSFLTDFRFFETRPLTNLYCSNPFPSPRGEDRSVVFRATSPEPQSLVVEYVTDLSSYGTRGEPITVQELVLFDDGQHDDLLAGDLVYGNRLRLPEGYTGLVPYCFRAGEYRYPHNGLYYINYTATKTFALNVNNAGIEDYRHLRIEDPQRRGKEHSVRIANTGESRLDLSYCSFQSGEYFNRFMFPPGTEIAAGADLLLTTDRAAATDSLGGDRILGDLFFDIALGDTMKLLTPALGTIVARVNRQDRSVGLVQAGVVINEIDYHSADDLDTGDWVELHNPSDAIVNLSGWYLQDDDDQHSFVLPHGTVVLPRGFLVLCQDGGALEALLGVDCVGDFEFGFRSSGERVRLYDRQGRLVDSVTYSDRWPWPEEIRRDGTTLELRGPGGDNADPLQWLASLEEGGTPGQVNSVYGPLGSREFDLSEAYPNPSFSTVGLDLTLGSPKAVTLEVYNTLGQLEEVLVDEVLGAGVSRFEWTPRERGSGVYFIALYLEGGLESVRKTVYLGP